jgi:hypothetical protein
MNLNFLVPIVTYPDPASEEGLVRALEMVASITGKFSVIVHEVDIPPVKSLLADSLIGLNQLVAKTEHDAAKGVSGSARP